MSFSVDTKNELARIKPSKGCCQLAEFAALMKMDGAIQISGRHEIALRLETESAGVARKVITYILNSR